MKYHFIATLVFSILLAYSSLPTAIYAIEPTTPKNASNGVQLQETNARNRSTNIEAKVEPTTQPSEVQVHDTKAQNKGISIQPEINTTPSEPLTYEPKTQPQPLQPTTSGEKKPTSIESQAKVNSDPKPSSYLSDLEIATYQLVNKYRQTHNLPPLVPDPTISALAKVHSEDMARLSKISHNGFKGRTTNISKTIVYRKAAENVGWNTGYKNPDLVMIEDWISSPMHQRNMLGPFDITGISIVKNNKNEYYFTQLFIRKAWYVKDMESPEEAKVQDTLVNAEQNQ